LGVMEAAFRRQHSASHIGGIVAIRREDQSVWERRAPLGPSQVRDLVKAGVKVLVQPSNRRAYPVQMYQQAGATIQEDISEAPVIMGVKQVPVDKLIPDKTFCFFSHTIKAQEANMPLLDAMLRKNVRLIDYERMVSPNGQRVVAFGKYAGVAGCINILHGIGIRLLALGHHTPFMHIGPAHNYRNTEMARQVIRDAGYEISLGMLPRSIGPLIFIFTGTGNVSKGAQSIFQDLPHEYVTVDMLKKVAEQGSVNKLYACEVDMEDHLFNRETGGFDFDEFIAHPKRYASSFARNIAPYASVIVNGIYWAPNSPRLITIPDAKFLLQPTYKPWLKTSEGEPALPQNMLGICDISADPGGSIEFVSECTTIDTPFSLYDADQNVESVSFKGPGVLVCSIDNMPTQLPRESTDFFGQQIMPYIADIIKSNAKDKNQLLCPEVASAVICSNGSLAPNYEYISEMRKSNKEKLEGQSTMAAKAQKVLVLGSGYVSEPLVEYLLRNQNTGIVLASAVKNEADAIAARYDACDSVFLNISDNPDYLDELVKGSDVVVSLLPYALHAKVARSCIANKTNMVTASYLTPEMKELALEAEEAGITVVNEVGLDPGIDHLLALDCFDEVKHGGGRVESFVSFCGGIPAPEHSDNPLRYKFSWSPRGVLLNTLAAAKYLKNNQDVNIKSGGGLLEAVESFDFVPGLNLEGFPNRDSTIYREVYGISDAHTILRGTLRYKGYAKQVQGLVKLGLIDPNPHPALHPGGPDVTWRQLVCSLMGDIDPNMFYDNLVAMVTERVGGDEGIMRGIEELGLLKEEVVEKNETPLDTLSLYLSKQLAYDTEERDLVVLRHDIGIVWPSGERERRGINFICYGDSNGYSAMAKTVGYPCAIATQMVLAGEIQQKGMVLPFVPEIFKPMLHRLALEGIKSTEKSYDQ